MIATLAVHEEMGKKCEVEASASIAAGRSSRRIADARFTVATLILPQLWAMSIGPLLNADQFAKFMSVIKKLSARVEDEHMKHLAELKRLEESSGATSLNGPANTGTGVIQAANVTDFESLVRGNVNGQTVNGLGGRGSQVDIFADDSPVSLPADSPDIQCAYCPPFCRPSRLRPRATASTPHRFPPSRLLRRLSHRPRLSPLLLSLCGRPPPLGCRRLRYPPRVATPSAHVPCLPPPSTAPPSLHHLSRPHRLLSRPPAPREHLRRPSSRSHLYSLVLLVPHRPRPPPRPAPALPVSNQLTTSRSPPRLPAAAFPLYSRLRRLCTAHQRLRSQHRKSSGTKYRLSRLLPRHCPPPPPSRRLYNQPQNLHRRCHPATTRRRRCNLCRRSGRQGRRGTSQRWTLGRGRIWTRSSRRLKSCCNTRHGSRCPLPRTPPMRGAVRTSCHRPLAAHTSRGLTAARVLFKSLEDPANDLNAPPVPAISSCRPRSSSFNNDGVRRRPRPIRARAEA